VGIEPTAEARVSFIAGAVRQGRYLKPAESRGILVGRALLKKFGTKLGRKLVLMSQGTDGRIASRAFRIVGVFGAEMEGTEKQFVFVSKAAAQAMLKLGAAVTEAAVMLPSRKQVARAAAELQAALPAGQQVSTWQELLPLVTINLDMFEGWIWLWFVLVFVAMGFGIVNTILMAIFERVREFGLMKALGMKPLWIVKGVLAEALLLLCLGMAAGNLLSLASIWLLSHTGIDLSSLAAGTEFAGMTRIIYPYLAAKDMTMANAVVLGLGLLISLYPAVKAARFTPVQALAHT
jgi:ABC-type lipoprotein release transport system permease subunit